MADKQPNISAQHPDYAAALTTWQKIADCIAGSDAMKAHDLNRALDDDYRYILRPNPDDATDKNWARYEQYVNRAVWYPVTARTHSGMVGQAFLKPPTLNVPKQLDRLLVDVDGSGTTLLQQAMLALGHTLSKGRCGLLTDYPPVEGTATAKDVSQGVVRPTIQLYGPEDVINWRTTVIGAEKVLSLVVLVETAQVDDDGYAATTETRYRELRLVEGVYTVLVWRKATSGSGFELVSTYVPKDNRDRQFSRIPFQTVGSESNDSAVDRAPLLDMAELNIAHLRNEADYEESCYMCGQATVWSNGLTDQWYKETLGGELKLGSRGGIPLPPGAGIGMLQAAANSMPKEAMDSKERYMVALGAKLIQPVQVQRTATEARLEYASEVSVLGRCANNVADAYVRALAFAGKFAGTEDKSEFAIDADAEMRKLSAEEQNQVVKNWQAKATAFSEMRAAMRRGGVATLDDEAAKEEIESSMDFTPPEVVVAPVVAKAERTKEEVSDA